MVASDNELNLVSEAETGGQNTMKHREMLASPPRESSQFSRRSIDERTGEWLRDASPRQISNRNKREKKKRKMEEWQFFHLVAYINRCTLSTARIQRRQRSHFYL